MGHSKLIRWLKARNIPVDLVVSVIAGIATAMILSIGTHEILYLLDIFPQINEPMHETNLVTIELIYHSIYAIIGAVVTARLAKDKAKRAAFILGTKEAIMWLLGTLLLWNHNPPWYNFTKALLGIPLAMFGGYLYVKFKKQPERKTITT
jgi:xanthine/uracil/vitamin C permease (AzgA family)